MWPVRFPGEEIMTPVRSGSGGGRWDGAEIELRSILRALWRQAGWICGFVLFVAAATLALLLSLTPRYTAETRLLIESRETAFTRPLQIQEREQLDERTVASQAQVLLSRDLARQVVRKLDLTKRPAFDPNVTPSLLRTALVLTGISSDSSRLPPEERALEILTENLSVYQVGLTRVIAVAFTSPDRQIAAEVANGIADTYLELQETAKQDAARQASTWLSGEIDGLRGRVGDAEQKVEAYRTSAGLLVGTNNTSLAAQQLSELNAQLAQAGARRTDAKAKSDLIREMLQSGGSIDATTDVLASPLIQRLREQQVALKARQAELAMTYLPAHPRLRDITAQVADVDRQIRAEAEKIARGLENEANLMEAREAALRQSLDELKKDAGALNGQEVELRSLEREARAQRELLEAYLVRYRDASARDSLGALPADARVISRASVPQRPSFPKVGPMLAATTVAAFLMAVGIVVTMELMSGQSIPAPPPGAVAAIGHMEVARRDDAARPTLIGHDVSPGAEAARAQQVAWAARLLAMAESARGEAPERGVLLLVAGVGRDSASPEAALELARALNYAGKRVVVLDLEIGRARLSNLVELGGKPGLGELVAGKASFGEALHRPASSRVHVMPAGAETGGAENQARLDIVLDALSHAYDVVVAHAGAAADLSPGVSGRAGSAVALVAAEGETSAAEVHRALVASGLERVVIAHRPAGAPAAEAGQGLVGAAA